MRNETPMSAEIIDLKAERTKRNVNNRSSDEPLLQTAAGAAKCKQPNRAKQLGRPSRNATRKLTAAELFAEEFIGPLEAAIRFRDQVR